MSRDIKKLKDFLKSCTDEKVRESVKRRIEMLEKKQTICKDEKASY